MDQEFDKYCLISYFEDANGKKQTWRLRDADHEELSEITIGQQTSIDSRIVYDERSKQKDGTKKAMINSSALPVEKNLTPFIAAAGEVQEGSNEQKEKSPLKKSKKKMTKAERRLLNNFRRGKRKEDNEKNF